MSRLVGVVYYEDDPEKTVFRVVYLLESDPDSVLDDPRWITEGCDPARKAIIEKIPSDALSTFTGMNGSV